MKKFLIIVVSVLVLLVLGNYLIFYQGFYLPWNKKEEVQAKFITKNEKIYIEQDGKQEELVIKGIELDSSMPYYNGTDYHATKEDYLRWLKGIGELGANTVKVLTIMDDDFYNAFYEYNQQAEHPLYLLQGIEVSNYASNSSEDAYSKIFYGELKQDARDVVDIIHGRKKIITNQGKGTGHYRKDISKWVIGYVIGSQWNTKTIVYTNQIEREYSSFQGEYFTTTNDATPFEGLLADIMNYFVSYESEKYGEQRLVTFYSDPEMDPFLYEEEYASQLNKYVALDMEHIRPTEQLKSGYFASYQLYEFCPEFYRYFSKQQKQTLGSLLTNLSTERYYDGYTQLLNRYHTMPVVILGYGYSSSRGSDSEFEAKEETKRNLTEKEQGEHLVQTYEDIIKAGSSGAIINSYKDIWSQRTWNTLYAVNVWNTKMWKDIQSTNTGYGLLTFDAGEQQKICYLDGDRSEWDQMTPIIEQNGMKIFMKQDIEGIYLLVEGEHVSEEDNFFIGFDTTPNSGATKAKAQKVTFERPVDFLLKIDGQEHSRLLVQERYESLRENYLIETQDEDPFIVIPEKDGERFVPIQMVLRNVGVEQQKFDEQGNPMRRLMNTFETGKLIYGNSNPNSEEYNSLADFYYGDGFVEIRIPWQLLNVSDPTRWTIHDDYYEKYGVEDMKIDHIYMGIIREEEKKQTMKLEKIKVEPLQKMPYHERFKQSYYIVKEYWNHQK